MSSQILRRILSFGGTEAVGRGLNWSLMAVLPFFLEPAEYGVIGLLVAMETVLATSLLIGQDRVVLRHFHDESIDNKALFATSTAIVTIASVLFMLFVLTMIFAGRPTFLGVRTYPELLLLSVLVLLGQLNRMALALARVESRPLDFSIHRVGGSVLKLLLVLVGVILYRTSVWYVVGASAALLLVLLARSRYLLSRIGNVDAKLFRKWLLFGWPFVFHTVSSGLLMFADRYMIDYFMGAGPVGIYTLSYSIGASVAFVFGALIIYIEPQVYRAGPGTELGERWLTILGAACTVLGSMFGALLVVAAGPAIDYKLMPEYGEAVGYIPIIIAAHLVMVIYFQSSFRLTAQGRTQIIAVCSASAAIANVVLNLYLIPRYGIIGAAGATFASYLILSIVTHVASLWGQSVPIRWKQWTMMGAIVVGATIVAAMPTGLLSIMSLLGMALFVATLFAKDVVTYRNSRRAVISDD